MNTRKTLLALATIPFIGLTACGDLSTESLDENGRVTEQEAKMQCEDIVKDRLKSPDSADFPRNDQYKFTPVADDGMQVNGWVDSENSFGASLRADFQCTVTPAENDQMFRHIDSFTER